MPDSATFALFLTAAFFLSVTPGPGILYTLARSLHGGRAEGVLSCFGLFIGGLFHVVAAAIGLSSLLMTSALAFSIVKYLGAAYLIYLGIRTLCSHDMLAVNPLIPSAPTSRQPQDSLAPSIFSSIFYQGVLTEMLNPKTALFFLAFIPQFITPDRGFIFLQFLALGLITTLFNFTADLTVALFAGPIGQRLKTNLRFRKGQRLASGVTLIGLGASVAVTDR